VTVAVAVNIIALVVTVAVAVNIIALRAIHMIATITICTLAMAEAQGMISSMAEAQGMISSMADFHISEDFNRKNWTFGQNKAGIGYMSHEPSECRSNKTFLFSRSNHIGKAA
jgi:hypothetical protein